MPLLDWIGKKAIVNHHKQVPFHLLRQNMELSAGDPDSKNLLVQGDNILVFWVRNIERREFHSFWLQTSTDKFYPDFVCKLKDGRFLVVEYKAETSWSNEDSREKRALGELWEKRSNGACLFVMPKGRDLAGIGGKV